MDVPSSTNNFILCQVNGKVAKMYSSWKSDYQVYKHYNIQVFHAGNDSQCSKKVSTNSMPFLPPPT